MSYIRNKPEFRCDICKSDVYDGELVHCIDGFIVCPDCFLDFAFDYFQDRLVPVSELFDRKNHILRKEDDE